MFMFMFMWPMWGLARALSGRTDADARARVAATVRDRKRWGISDG